MKTFAITWRTNYGELVMIVNFENFSIANYFAESDERIGDDYDICELSSDRGVVFFGGGDG